MVSSRGIKFTQGEKVLCYEPDPQKTRVLYNSKVLDIIRQKDASGKRVVNFLIHFQGWNAAWDRCVPEEYVLKDTDENRRLQTELAQTAQLTAKGGGGRGGNLYKREGKKRKLNSRSCPIDGGDVKRSSHQTPTGDQNSESDGSDDDQNPLSLPSALKRILEHDHDLVRRHGKVLNLPAVPNAISILEQFLKDYARSQMRQACTRKTHFRASALGAASVTQSVEGFCRNMNLCREVVDGLRVYLDFMLDRGLIYNEEKAQFQEAVAKKLTRMDVKIKMEVDDEACLPPPTIVPRKKVEPLEPKKPISIPGLKEEIIDEVVPGSSETVTSRRRSLRSHAAAEILTKVAPSVSRSSPSESSFSKLEGRKYNYVKTRRKFQSSVTCVTRAMTPREREVMDEITNWKLLPDKALEGDKVYPSVIYGATHLLRAFVKLPEVLQQPGQNEVKLNLLLDYLSNFLKFLEDHQEWFGEHQYRDNIYIKTAEETLF